METFCNHVFDTRCADEFADVKEAAEKVHQAMFDLYQLIGTKFKDDPQLETQMPDQAPRIELGGRGRMKYDKARRTIVSEKKEFTIHIEETRHFEFKVWASDKDTALQDAVKIWRESPTVGQWELPDTDTTYRAAHTNGNNDHG